MGKQTGITNKAVLKNQLNQIDSLISSLNTEFNRLNEAVTQMKSVWHGGQRSSSWYTNMNNFIVNSVNEKNVALKQMNQSLRDAATQTQRAFD